MNLLINASNVRQGGGVTVCLNLLEELLPLRDSDKVYLIHPVNYGYETLSRFPNVMLLPVSDSFHHSYLAKIRHNQFVFRAWCRKFKIDKVVSMGNVAFRCDGRPQLLYVQNAFLVYPDSPAWKHLSWRHFLKHSLVDQWSAMHLKQASAYVVQTEIIKERFVNRFEIDKSRVQVIPLSADSHSVSAPPRDQDGKRKLLFLSHWYPHKNYECLIPLAKMIAGKALPVSISLTLSRKEGGPVRDFLKEIKQEGLEAILPNIGTVPRAEVGRVMQEHDALFLPTLLETFSGAYAEALQCGRPIFTSHYDFATPLGEAAWYFDPLNTEAIFKVIEDAIADDGAFAAKTAAAVALDQSMPRWPQIAAIFSEVIDTFA